MGMAAMSSTHSTHIDVGGNGHCSVSSFHDGGGMLFHGCGSLMRGVGAIWMHGVNVVDVGDVVGMGGLCCGVHG